MGCSLRELFVRFDSRELSQWETYFGIEPWGWQIENLRFGTLASIACPEAARDLARPENWFTDELPKLSLYDDEDE